MHPIYLGMLEILNSLPIPKLLPSNSFTITSRTLLHFILAKIMVLPRKPWIPPPYIRLIFLAANALPKSLATIKISPLFPVSRSLKIQIDLNLCLDGFLTSFSFFLSDFFFTSMSVRVSIYETNAMIERSHKTHSVR